MLSPPGLRRSFTSATFPAAVPIGFAEIIIYRAAVIRPVEDGPADRGEVAREEPSLGLGADLLDLAVPAVAPIVTRRLGVAAAALSPAERRTRATAAAL